MSKESLNFESLIENIKKLSTDAKAVIGESFEMVMESVIKGNVEEAGEFAKELKDLINERLDGIANQVEASKDDLSEQLQTAQDKIEEQGKEITQLQSDLDKQKTSSSKSLSTANERITTLEKANKELSQKLNIDPLEPKPTAGPTPKFNNWREYDKHLETKVTETLEEVLEEKK